MSAENAKACEWCFGDAPATIATHDNETRIAILPCGHLVCAACLWGAVDARRLDYKVPDPNHENDEDLADIDFHVEPNYKMMSKCVCGATFRVRAALDQTLCRPVLHASSETAFDRFFGPLKKSTPADDPSEGPKIDSEANNANEIATEHANDIYRCERCNYCLKFCVVEDLASLVKLCSCAVSIYHQLHVLKTTLEQIVNKRDVRQIALSESLDEINSEISRLFHTFNGDLRVFYALNVDALRGQHPFGQQESVVRARAANVHSTNLRQTASKYGLQRHAEILRTTNEAQETIGRISTLEALLNEIKLDLASLIFSDDRDTTSTARFRTISRQIFHARRMAHSLGHSDEPTPEWMLYLAAPKTIDRYTFTSVAIGRSLNWCATLEPHAHRLKEGPLTLKGTTSTLLARDRPGDERLEVVGRGRRFTSPISQAHIAPDGAVWFTRHSSHGHGTRKLFRTDPNTKRTFCVRVGGQRRVLAFVIAANGLAVVVLGSRPARDGYERTQQMVATTVHGRVWQMSCDRDPYVASSLTALNEREVGVCDTNLFEVHTFDVDSGCWLRTVVCSKALLKTTLPVPTNFNSSKTPAVVLLAGTHANSSKDPVLVLSGKHACVKNWSELLTPEMPHPLRPDWFCSNVAAHILACGELRVPRVGQKTAVFDLLRGSTSDETAASPMIPNVVEIPTETPSSEDAKQSDTDVVGLNFTTLCTQFAKFWFSGETSKQNQKWI